VASLVERKTGRGERRLYVTWRDRAGKQHWTLVNAKTVELQADEASFGRKAAGRLKRRIEESVDRCGSWPEPTKQAPSIVTLANAADAWLARHKANLRPRVHTCYELSLRLHVKPLLGSKILPDIGPADAKLLRDSMRSGGQV